MRQYEIIITPAAEKDLQQIFRYIATELLEPQTALNLCDKTEQELLKLDTMSDRHPQYKKEPWFSRGLRFFPVGKFLVFYITRESDSTVHVLRVMYGGRNVEEQL
ncbi:type II toxin-antitoxin system RelE/ParE family toxin [Desulfosporosinus sp.]|uniref:type II toxin-antitoxin system RelE/ParE family toxin n=1 Tax=Desulfosporosinus sp. TaxID=157907 RepID=UPI0025C46156|nr:type II toxin-antitoxin system RelE/ParE family toxin [Desulfosporosinus sp.]MBC2723018.1 type II toxin-antitoxin system RelE/ParE family toxin [Desulfosporosinus sp.]MBC2727202.1 type II toxin-antitoxin system RelE/ParE family toxin [Desulfosporosinus sp.]